MNLTPEQINIIIVIGSVLVTFGLTAFVSYLRYKGIIDKKDNETIDDAQKILFVVAKIVKRFSGGLADEIELIEVLIQSVLDYCQEVLELDGQLPNEQAMLDFALGLMDKFEVELTEDDKELLEDIVEIIYELNK